MTTVRVMAVFQGGSGLPEDRFINTFHFHTPVPGVYSVAAQRCRDRVADFYLNDSGIGAIAPFLSNYIQRTFNVTSYNLEEPAGSRVPTTDPWTLPTAVGETGMPEEVAVVLTLQGVAPINARRRGRIYLGPWCDSPSVIDYASANAPARVESGVAGNITSKILTAASILSSSTADEPWCIRSVTPVENFVPIVQGYVDDAFDIQRRRGPDPTLRSTFVPIA